MPRDHPLATRPTERQRPVVSRVRRVTGDAPRVSRPPAVGVLAAVGVLGAIALGSLQGPEVERVELVGPSEAVRPVITFDGVTCRYDGPAVLVAEETDFQVANAAGVPVVVALASLAEGRPLEDVTRAWDVPQVGDVAVWAPEIPRSAFRLLGPGAGTHYQSIVRFSFPLGGPYAVVCGPADGRGWLDAGRVEVRRSGVAGAGQRIPAPEVHIGTTSCAYAGPEALPVERVVPLVVRNASAAEVILEVVDLREETEPPERSPVLFDADGHHVLASTATTLSFTFPGPGRYAVACRSVPDGRLTIAARVTAGIVDADFVLPPLPE